MKSKEKPKYKGMHLTQKEFDLLPEYSLSQPTGVYIGKCWKRQKWSWDEDDVKAGKNMFEARRIWHNIWIICTYEDEPDQKTYPDEVRNGYYWPLIGDIEAGIIEEFSNATYIRDLICPGCFPGTFMRHDVKSNTYCSICQNKPSKEKN